MGNSLCVLKPIHVSCFVLSGLTTHLQPLQFKTCCSSSSVLWLLIKNTNCSTIHNQSGSFINNRTCHSSSKHAPPSENPQLGQECKVDKSQAHQHIFQRVQHRRYITKHHNQTDSKDEERKVLQNKSSRGQQRVVRGDGHAQSRHEGEDVDWEHPGWAEDQWFSCHSHHLHSV